MVFSQLLGYFKSAETPIAATEGVLQNVAPEDYPTPAK